MKPLLVKAREGIEVPMEGAPKRKIGSAPIEVQPSNYYRRVLRDGDLVEVTNP